MDGAEEVDLVKDNWVVGHAGDGTPEGTLRGGFGGADVRVRVGLESSVVGAEWLGETDDREGLELEQVLSVRRSPCRLYGVC